MTDFLYIILNAFPVLCGEAVFMLEGDKNFCLFSHMELKPSPAWGMESGLKYSLKVVQKPFRARTQNEES